MTLKTDRWTEGSIGNAVAQAEAMVEREGDEDYWAAAHEDFVGFLKLVGTRQITDDLLYVMLATALSVAGTTCWYTMQTCGSPHSLPHTLSHIEDGATFFCAVVNNARRFHLGEEI
jgi:hypothetical protein